MIGCCGDSAKSRKVQDNNTSYRLYQSKPELYHGNTYLPYNQFQLHLSSQLMAWSCLILLGDMTTCTYVTLFEITSAVSPDLLENSLLTKQGLTGQEGLTSMECADIPYLVANQTQGLRGSSLHSHTTYKNTHHGKHTLVTRQSKVPGSCRYPDCISICWSHGHSTRHARHLYP